MVRDMTAGSHRRQILLFALPMLLGNIFQQLYSMADTVIVGRYLGMEALAAVGATGSVSFFILGFVQGVTTGFSIVTAHHFGAGDVAKVKRSIRCCALLSALTAAVMTALSVPLARPLLALMRTPAELLDAAALYIRVICAGLFATVFYNMIAAILRALGDSRTPLIFLVVSSLLNVALDVLFILGLGAGVEGAAYATVLSQFIAAALCLRYGRRHCEYLHAGGAHARAALAMAREHLRVGVPMGLQFSVTAIGSMVMQSTFNQFGTVGVAAYTAAGKVEQVVTQPGAALGLTMATYCGQNKGANRHDRILAGMRDGALFCLVSCAVGALVNFTLGGALVSLFLSERTAQVMAYARTYLNVTALFYPALGMLFIYRNSLQGLGESLVPMLGGVAELGARVLMCLLLPMRLGYLGACLASPMAWVAAAALTMGRYLLLARTFRKNAPLRALRRLKST